MLEIDILKRKYRQFRQWQKQPAQYDHSRNETHHCNNCGQEFTGSHCFACGQKHTVGRISWLTVRQGVMDIWGIGTRSLPYTLLQLIFRPGYLIHDYISGKRQVCFPPVKMLFIVTICCLFIVKWFFPHVLGINYQHVYDESEEYFSTFSYLMTHQKAWGILYALSAMIIPTWVIFRYAPKYKRHSLPEGFYIQIFIGTVLPFFPIFYRLLPSIINYLFYIFFPIFYYITYKQLFGYGYWGTFWRLVLMLFCGYTVLCVMDRIISLIIRIWNPDVKIENFSLVDNIILYVVPIGILLLSHLINLLILKYQHRKAKEPLME